MMANVRCAVILERRGIQGGGEWGFTVGEGWDKFFVAHPDLVHLRLCLFNMGGVEVYLNDRIFNGDELLLRPRVCTDG
jgi:hypothetical protein